MSSSISFAFYWKSFSAILCAPPVPRSRALGTPVEGPKRQPTMGRRSSGSADVGDGGCCTCRNWRASFWNTFRWGASLISLGTLRDHLAGIVPMVQSFPQVKPAIYWGHISRWPCRDGTLPSGLRALNRISNPPSQAEVYPQRREYNACPLDQLIEVRPF